jgi:hypothetical protein
MKLARIAIVSGLLIASSGGLAAPATRLLLPLSEKDQDKITEMGCNSAFTHGKQTLVFAIAPRLIVRTLHGANVCPAGGAAINAFFDGGKPLACGGVKMKLHMTGKMKGNAEADSSSGPAALTVTNGTITQTIAGEAGTAC